MLRIRPLVPRLCALVALGIAVFLASEVFFNHSLGWFRHGTELEATSMNVSVGTSAYQIEVRGAYEENSDMFTLLDDALLEAGVSAIREGEQVSAPSPYYQTTDAKNIIFWHKSTQDASDGHYEDGLEPDSEGKLEFWVVAKEAGTYDPVFTFSIRGFHAETHEETHDGRIIDIVDSLHEINSSLGTNVPTLTQTEIARKTAALSFIEGHILFFADRDNDGFYEGFLGAGRSIRLSDIYTAPGGTTFTAGEKKHVTVYWKWANTFEQMVYDSNHSSYAPIIKDSDSADRSLIYTYLSEDGETVFAGMTSTQINSGLTLVRSGGTGAAEAVLELSNAYNEADQEIGDCLSYILIEMNVQ